MIKAVVFDLDHTLFDRHGTLKSLVPALRKEFDVNSSLSDKDIGELWCYADDNFVYFGWENIWGYLKENNVFNVPPSFEAYRSFIYKYFAITAVPFPDTVPAIQKLRSLGYKTAIITNGNHALQYSKIDMLLLRPYFDEIIVTGDYEIHKPDKEIFDIMRGKFVFSPEEMVYVGDNPVNDIKGARSAGWKTVWMNSTGYWDETVARADREVRTVGEVIDAVLSLEE